MKYKTKLVGSKRLTPLEYFQTMAKYAQSNNFDYDFYGTGDSIQEFEKEVAEFLGMEKSIFRKVIKKGVFYKTPYHILFF